jgi:excisionase family DNA binding protein
MAGLIDRRGDDTLAGWDRLLTVKEAAEYVPCSVQTIRRAYLVGQLTVARFGHGWGRVRIRQTALEAWLRNGGRTQPTEGDGRA